MRFRYLSITVILVVCLSAHLLAGPDIKIPESTFNFGKVTQKKTVTHTFWIKSVGDDTLKITSIWPGCSCTQIPLKDSSVAPGDSLPLTIILNTQRFYGEVTKHPSINTNATDDKIEFSLWLDVLVDSSRMGALDVQPRELDVSQFGNKIRRVAKFLVVNTTDNDLNLTVTDSNNKSFEVRLPDRVKAGETIEGKIRVNEDMVEKDFKESLTFEVVDLDNATYSVPIKRMYYPDKR